MKKIFLFSILVALFMAACEPEPGEITTAVTVSLSTSSFSAVGLPTSDTTVTIVVSNTTNEAATINWIRSETQTVSGWSYMVNSASAASGFLAIAANSSVNVTLQLNPNGNIGNATGNIVFYDPNDQTGTTQTFTYDYTISNPPTGVTVQLSSTGDTEVGLASATRSFNFSVSNNSAQAATINWTRTETQVVSGWTYLVNGSNATSGTLNIPAFNSVNVTLQIDGNSIVGHGTGTLEFYDAGFQTTTTQTYTYDYATVTSWFSLSPVGSMTRSISVIDPATDYDISVVNNNAVAIPVRWERVANPANPAGWVSLTCAGLDCYSPSVVVENFIIPANSSMDYKLTINHNGIAGVGTVDNVFYVVQDSAFSHRNQLVSHTVTP